MRGSLFFLRVDIPEPKSLITCASDNSLAVRADSKVEHATGMSEKSGCFLHLWVFPEHDLVLGVAVCTGELIDVLGEHEIADLGAGLHTVQLRSCKGVPKPNAAVSSAATAGKQAMLMR